MIKSFCDSLLRDYDNTWLVILGGLIAGLMLSTSQAGELQTISAVQLVETEWADGDSFRVVFPNGVQHTLRLYGADCIELHIGSGDTTDARRLRAQRRYFGISNFGNNPRQSIAKAIELARQARTTTFELLAQPFTVHTAFADGGGDGRYKRIYAFVETAAGRDLATMLVERGLARAFGVYRSTPDGQSRTDYIEQLKDAELVAASRGRGAWQFTDWDKLQNQRLAQRLEERDLEIAMGTAPPSQPLDPNTAARDELMTIPGIGEVTANRIIEQRPFAAIEELERVTGIGRKTLEKIRPYLTVATPTDD